MTSGCRRDGWAVRNGGRVIVPHHSGTAVRNGGRVIVPHWNGNVERGTEERGTGYCSTLDGCAELNVERVIVPHHSTNQSKVEQ